MTWRCKGREAGKISRSAEETGGGGWVGKVDLEGWEDGDGGRDTIRLGTKPTGARRPKGCEGI